MDITPSEIEKAINYVPATLQAFMGEKRSKSHLSTTRTTPRTLIPKEIHASPGLKLHLQQSKIPSMFKYHPITEASSPIQKYFLHPKTHRPLHQHSMRKEYFSNRTSATVAKRFNREFKAGENYKLPALTERGSPVQTNMLNDQVILGKDKEKEREKEKGKNDELPKVLMRVKLNKTFHRKQKALSNENEKIRPYRTAQHSPRNVRDESVMQKSIEKPCFKDILNIEKKQKHFISSFKESLKKPPQSQLISSNQGVISPSQGSVLFKNDFIRQNIKNHSKDQHRHYLFDKKNTISKCKENIEECPRASLPLFQTPSQSSFIEDEDERRGNRVSSHLSRKNEFPKEFKVKDQEEVENYIKAKEKVKPKITSKLTVLLGLNKKESPLTDLASYRTYDGSVPVSKEIINQPFEAQFGDLDENQIKIIEYKQQQWKKLDARQILKKSVRKKV